MMHLSPHECDLLCAGLMPAEQAAPLREHLSGCAACAARLADAEAARAAFLVKNPPPARARALLDEAGRRPRRRWWWLGGLSGAAAAAAAALLFMMTPQGTRLKGADLTCRIVRGANVLALVEAGRTADAQAGDVLRCTFDGNVEVRGDDGVRVWSGSGPTDQSFAITGNGPQRLYFHWSDGREQWVGVMVR
jgi:hypothetical protein